MDKTPSPMTLLLAARSSNLSSFLGVDEDGITWSFDLPSPHGGGAYWFTSTVSNRIVKEGECEVVSQYDEDKDRWFVLVGNYGVPSEHFTNWREVHRP